MRRLILLLMLIVSAIAVADEKTGQEATPALESYSHASLVSGAPEVPADISGGVTWSSSYTVGLILSVNHFQVIYALETSPRLWQVKTSHTLERLTNGYKIHLQITGSSPHVMHALLTFLRIFHGTMSTAFREDMLEYAMNLQYKTTHQSCELQMIMDKMTRDLDD